MRRVTDCKASANYELWLRFDNGVEGTLFLGSLLEVRAFGAWRDASQFCSARPDAAGTVVWQDGIRFEPDVLYQDLLARSVRADNEFSLPGLVAVAG